MPQNDAAGAFAGCVAAFSVEPDSSDSGRIGRMHLRSVINVLPGTFYVLREDGTFALWNKTVEAVTGLNSEEMRTAQALDMFDLTEKPKINEKIRQVFERGDQVFVEANLLDKNGHGTPYLLTGARIECKGTNLPVRHGPRHFAAPPAGRTVAPARARPARGQQRHRHHPLQRPRQSDRVRQSRLRAHHRLPPRRSGRARLALHGRARHGCRSARPAAPRHRRTPRSQRHLPQPAQGRRGVLERPHHHPGGRRKRPRHPLHRRHQRRHPRSSSAPPTSSTKSITTPSPAWPTAPCCGTGSNRRSTWRSATSRWWRPC